MSIFAHPQFLRRVLWADAFAGAASSLLHLLGAGLLGSLLGISHQVLAASGIALLVFVALAAYLASCDPVPRRLVGVLVAGNWAWVVGCAVFALMNAYSLTLLGQAYVVIHAVAVALLAELQWMGLRRAPRHGWA
ncbi:MAG: hypothetical protein Q8R63_10690 [Ramlibacter sp.]|nr:hypothetical protein [Ramlibacter sp.]